MELTSVLIKPLLSEKVSYYAQKHNCVCFKVHPDANKIEIRRAVEELFDVHVVKVNVVRVRAEKCMRQGRVIGKRAGYKKAYVTLTEDSKIQLFAGA